MARLAQRLEPTANMTLPDIQQGHVLRLARSIPPREKADSFDHSYDDSGRERMPEYAFYNYDTIDKQADGKAVRYAGWAAYSVDWREHPSCLSPGLLVARHNRADRSSPCDTAWELPVYKVTVPFTINGDEHRFAVEHWEENDNAAHAHLLLPQQFAGKGKKAGRRRKRARIHLTQRAVRVHPPTSTAPWDPMHSRSSRKVAVVVSACSVALVLALPLFGAPLWTAALAALSPLFAVALINRGRVSRPTDS